MKQTTAEFRNHNGQNKFLFRLRHNRYRRKWSLPQYQVRKFLNFSLWLSLGLVFGVVSWWSKRARNEGKNMASFRHSGLVSIAGKQRKSVKYDIRLPFEVSPIPIKKIHFSIFSSGLFSVHVTSISRVYVSIGVHCHYIRNITFVI